MRFAMACLDRYASVFEALITAKWQPVKLFSCFSVNPLDQNSSVLAKASSLKLDIQLSPLNEHDLKGLQELQCEILVVAGYDTLIPPWQGFLPYAINFHPSPLPEGRGPYPLVRAILENRRGWGVSCHKIGRSFDRGDVLDRELFPMDEGECHESLDLKCQMGFHRLASRLAATFEHSWHNASPQGPGSYWKGWDQSERRLDFNESVGSIMRRVRAFGSIETTVDLSGALFYVREAVGWTESHSHRPGSVVHMNMNRVVIAASDGYIALLRWNAVPAERRKLSH